MVKESQLVKNNKRSRRRAAIRKHMWGTSERPRLVVFRSLKHIYAQIINDDKGNTLCAMSSKAKDFKTEGAARRTEISFQIGQKLGEKAMAIGITKVTFDRAGYKYHGRVKSLADGARKAGLTF